MKNARCACRQQLAKYQPSDHRRTRHSSRIDPRRPAPSCSFEVFSQRYERGSILVTSNLPFDEWTEIFGSERLTGALLDRLTHHVHILRNERRRAIVSTKAKNARKSPSKYLLNRKVQWLIAVGPQEPAHAASLRVGRDRRYSKQRRPPSIYGLPGQPPNTAYRITLSGLERGSARVDLIQAPPLTHVPLVPATHTVAEQIVRISYRYKMQWRRADFFARPEHAR